MRVTYPAFAAPALLLAGLLPALGAPDIIHGERLAKRWCAECHVVAPDQTSAKADVPSFADVASRKTAKQIAAFLTDPHPKMPDMNLSRDETADLAAYIKTLAPGPQDPTPPKPEQDDAGLPKRG